MPLSPGAAARLQQHREYGVLFRRLQIGDAYIVVMIGALALVAYGLEAGERDVHGPALALGQILYLPVAGPVGLGLIGGAALLAGHLDL